MWRVQQDAGLDNWREKKEKEKTTVNKEEIQSHCQFQAVQKFETGNKYILKLLKLLKQ